MTCIAICGDSASGKTVITNLLAYRLGNTTILECDRYHKWERHNPNWTEYTHLNPLANNLDLLNQDVRDLKNGRTIFRRDYDHSVGKFTEEREIKPLQNIIVCGLHSFICSKGLYDLKIFMNPNSTLKTEWKIARDMTKRGYTIEQVEEQIKRRKRDFELFVLPLALGADIVVNFHTKSDLRIFIHEKYSIGSIVQQLKNLNVDFSVSEHQIDIKTGTNYDYVILCILDILKQK